ncbi:hypothetical protein LCGC14_3028390, partial [marine sediment metagenome]
RQPQIVANPLSEGLDKLAGMTRRAGQQLKEAEQRQDFVSAANRLAALAERPISPPEPPNWVEGGYLQQVPLDPWGNAYGYRSPGEDGAFDLLSLGADGQPGGDGSAADIRHGTQKIAGR